MARTSWINDDSHPDLDAHVDKLEHFTKSIADGVVDDDELETQENNLVAAMNAPSRARSVRRAAREGHQAPRRAHRLQRDAHAARDGAGAGRERVTPKS